MRKNNTFYYRAFHFQPKKVYRNIPHLKCELCWHFVFITMLQCWHFVWNRPTGPSWRFWHGLHFWEFYSLFAAIYFDLLCLNRNEEPCTSTSLCVAALSSYTIDLFLCVCGCAFFSFRKNKINFIRKCKWMGPFCSGSCLCVEQTAPSSGCHATITTIVIRIWNGNLSPESDTMLMFTIFICDFPFPTQPLTRHSFNFSCAAVGSTTIKQNATST